MIYLGASIVGFVGFIVATWAFLGAIPAHITSDTALAYMLVGGLVGCMLMPLVLWRWLASPIVNTWWFAVATALGFLVFATATMIAVCFILPDLAPELVVAPMIFGGLVGGALAVVAVRRYQAKWASQPE